MSGRSVSQRIRNQNISPAALTTESRDDVRLLIGEQAEALVFVFGMSDRKRLLLENRSPPYRWIDHRTGEQTEIVTSA